MRKIAAVVVLLGCLWCASLADQASGESARTCAKVQTKKITGQDVEVSPHFGCSGARKVLRKYFHLVVNTGQTMGGCAQKRSSVGCKIKHYRCFTKYVYATNELEGHCKGPKGTVWFIEHDRGPR